MEDYVKLWAKRCRDDLADIPQDFNIHKDFLYYIDKEDFDYAFRYMRSLFDKILEDISVTPEKFKFPIISSDEHDYSDAKGLEARTIPWRPLEILYNISLFSRYENKCLTVDAQNFLSANKVPNHQNIFKALTEYGFVFTSLNNFKVTKNTADFTAEFYDCPDLLYVMNNIAKKANKNNRRIDFLLCSYRILEHDFNSVPYIDLPVFITDRLHNESEKQFCMEFDKVMREKGYFSDKSFSNQGPYINYYDKEKVMLKKGPYVYKVAIRRTESKLMLLLRMRNVDKCIEQLDNFPESVKDMFLYTDEGCICRKRGDCTHSVHYQLEGKERWHCGSWQAPFQLHPKPEDIPHYIKLIELGVKK